MRYNVSCMFELQASLELIGCCNCRLRWPILCSRAWLRGSIGLSQLSRIYSTAHPAPYAPSAQTHPHPPHTSHTCTQKTRTGQLEEAKLFCDFEMCESSYIHMHPDRLKPGTTIAIMFTCGKHGTCNSDKAGDTLYSCVYMEGSIPTVA